MRRGNPFGEERLILMMKRQPQVLIYDVISMPILGSLAMVSSENSGAVPCDVSESHWANQHVWQPEETSMQDFQVQNHSPLRIKRWQLCPLSIAGL